MNIKLATEVLDQSNKKKDLSYLIRTIVRRKHKIVFDIDFQVLPTWLDSEDRGSLEDFFSASIIGDSQIPHCEVIKNASHISHDKKFSIEEAIDYVNTPLTIMVENSNNDSPLVILILDLYTKHKTDPYYQGFLAFGHAGGCGSIKAVITEKLRQNCQRPKMLRYYIIVDGDKRYETEEVNKYNTLIKFLTENNIPYHIFGKRCMENYMPIEAFPNRADNSNWINAYKSLSPIQRDYFNIGSGLKGDLTDDDKKN